MGGRSNAEKVTLSVVSREPCRARPLIANTVLGCQGLASFAAWRPVATTRYQYKHCSVKSGTTYDTRGLFCFGFFASRFSTTLLLVAINGAPSGARGLQSYGFILEYLPQLMPSWILLPRSAMALGTPEDGRVSPSFVTYSRTIYNTFRDGNTEGMGHAVPRH